jgi:hypothetical protein
MRPCRDNRERRPTDDSGHGRGTTPIGTLTDRPVEARLLRFGPRVARVGRLQMTIRRLPRTPGYGLPGGDPWNRCPR